MFLKEDYKELREIKKGETGEGLLIEHDGFVSLEITQHNKQLKESVEGHDGWYVPKPFIVDCVLQKFGIKNANGRIYPEDVLKSQVEEYQQVIAERRALGELNHPADSTIDLGRISHNIIECHWEGHTLVGKLELNISEGFRKLGICSTLGDTCAQLLLNGWKIGISSRGVGEVKERLGTTYVTEYQLIGWDIVSQPSSPGAWLTTNGKEDLQQYVESKNNDSVLSEKIDKLENILND